MDYHAIPIGHSIAFSFDGYNMRPYLDSQLAPYFDRLAPYSGSFVGMSDASQLAAAFDSIRTTTLRAAAPSPIATRILHITHAASTTFVSPAEAVEAPTPLPSQVVEEATTLNGTSTLNNTIWLVFFLYIVVLLAFMGVLMAYGRPKERPQPETFKEKLVYFAPSMTEEKPIMVSRGQSTDEDETYNLLQKRILELETLEEATNGLRDRVIHLENVEEQLKGTVKSLRAQPTAALPLPPLPSPPPPQSQADQEFAWSKQKKKLQDDNSKLREDSTKKDATIRTQKTAHLEKEVDWQREMNTLQWKFDTYKMDATKHEQLSREHSELEVKYGKSEQEVARLAEQLSTVQSTLKAQGAIHEDRIVSMEQARENTQNRHKQELSRASQDTEQERLRANESEEKHKSLIGANQLLQASYDDKVSEATNLNDQVASLKHAFGDAELRVQERDTRIVEITEERSHCYRKLELLGHECIELEDQVQELQSIHRKGNVLDNGPQGAELEDHVEPTPERLSPMPSPIIEKSQTPSMIIPETKEAMLDIGTEHEQPVINLPGASAFALVAAVTPSKWASKPPPPASAAKGPRANRKPDYNPSYPTFGNTRAGNHYSIQNFLLEVPHSDPTTTSDYRTQYLDENGKQPSFSKYWREHMRERGGLQDSRGRGHSSSGRGGYRPRGQTGGRATNRGGYRGRGRAG